MRLNRRHFCAMSVGLLLSCSETEKSPFLFEDIDLDFYVFDDDFHDLIRPETKASILSQGFQWSEGPSWDLNKQILYFTDVPKNEAYSWSASEGLKVFLNPSGAANVQGFREPGANGLFFDYQSRLLLCNHGRRSIEFVQGNGSVRKTLADSFDGHKFNSPNDIVATRDGHIFFTDPPYGLEGLNQSELKELPHNGVYYLNPHGVISLIDKSMSFPNGVAVSPDQTKLYVSQSDPEEPIIMCFELDASYKVVKKYVFFDFSAYLVAGAHGLPDGMTLDSSGNLFATGPGGIFVIRPDGQILGRIGLDRASSNCTFGENGKTLFITNQDRLLRIETQALGLRWL
ncbi:MAG: SMP-30/gluconolactonase/LRE family protein [Maricaulaceae bacterium]